MPLITYCTGPCWNERTAGVPSTCCRPCSWSAGNTCVTTGWSRRRDTQASLRTPSCSASMTWICRISEYHLECRIPCRPRWFSLQINHRGYQTFVAMQQMVWSLSSVERACQIVNCITAARLCCSWKVQTQSRGEFNLHPPPESISLKVSLHKCA